MSRSPRQHNSFRIIGGAWKRRRLQFAPVSGLRPTPDRVRETLFNWLQPVIAGARCLDLFAGSGALGWEALSRGAREVVLVERDRRAVASLHASAQTLGADTARIVQADAVAWLRGPATAFDVVFVDPPYASGLLPGVLSLLTANGWLAPGAHLYAEYAAHAGPPEWPAGVKELRQGDAGAVGYVLLTASDSVVSTE